jgi:NAD(P)-dependent dehydrogenase (short-subunit alcohol dehydrogenase family)
VVGEGALALVTGANRGLGRETARQLARRGVGVLLASRDAERGAEVARELAADAGGGGGKAAVWPVRLDVTDPGQVAAVADLVRRDHGRLDILVNNAAVFLPATAEATTVAELRPLFEANVFGAVTVIHALLPLLRRSAAPRVVNVSSTTASLTLTGRGEDLPGDATVRMAYTASKAALNMLTLQYAQAFARDPGLRHLKINAATPGYTATDMNGFRGTRSVAEGARSVVELATLPDDGPTGGFFSDEGPVPW